MLKNGILTYISLFSSAGVGCYGFKQEGFECIATNEFIQRRIDVQKYNQKCKYNSGYIQGDIKLQKTKDLIQEEIKRYKKEGNDEVDVLIATPPCQGMSVANHKKTENEIDRNSLVVESILMTKSIRPRFFIFENVAAFLHTGCTSPSKDVKAIGQVIDEELGCLYEIKGRVINFKNYGNNSSRTRTLVIGVRKDYEEFISPIDLFPDYTEEKTLREIIGSCPSLKWGEINSNDILHAFRTYPKEMEAWIDGMPAGNSAFDNEDEKKRPHTIVDGKIVPNVRKNGDKYTRQYWDKVAPCIHTRNDQLASQNTIHPSENRVFSIRELMLMMTIPSSFKWTNAEYSELNNLTQEEKILFYKENEIKIRQSIGEAVPTTIFRQIAHKIKENLLSNNFKINVEKRIQELNLSDFERLSTYLENNPDNYSFTLLSKIAELANGKRMDTDAYYTNKSLLNHIYNQLPDTSESEISILEPSVGVGNFLPYIFKKYESVSRVNLDVVDIDGDSLKTLKILLKKIKVPSNFKIKFINEDYLLFNPRKRYFLVVGNPPFTKTSRTKKPEYFKNVINTDTTNLAALFLEKAISESDNVVMIEPKFVINTAEFRKTRELLSRYRLLSINDFGEKGFKGVLIETVCIAVQTNVKVSLKARTQIKHVTLSINNNPLQSELTSNKYPYWLLYRNEYFDQIAETMLFDCFTVFRDRQISNSDLSDTPGNNMIRVLKSRNITNDGSVVSINGYDSYISLDALKGKSVYKYFNNDNVYLVPNMTYNPRMIRNPNNTTVNGSLAILIPKYTQPTESQIHYFSTDEFRKFYQIARNYQTRSLNIDETSVYFFGLKGVKRDD